MNHQLPCLNIKNDDISHGNQQVIDSYFSKGNNKMAFIREEKVLA